MKKINIIYLLAGLAGFLMLPRLKENLSNSVEFYGIAENPVKSVNFDYPVEIVRLYKKQGESLQYGDTVMTLRRLDLRTKETSLHFDLADNDTRLRAANEGSSHEIAILENQKNQLEAEYRYKTEILKQKQTKFKAGQKYLLKSDTLLPSSPEILTELQQLETKYKQELSDLNLKIRQKNKDKSASIESHRIKMAKVLKELEQLKNSEGELTIVSTGPGMVGQLDYGEGDRIPEFTPLAKFYDQHPGIVIFYIGDQQLTLLNEGDSVWVESINLPDVKFKGVISAMGNRITSLPERLKKIPELRAWGREVQVKIPSSNRFLQGEKVKVYF